MMTTILVLGFLIFGSIVYAIYKGYGVKAAMKWLGASDIRSTKGKYSCDRWGNQAIVMSFFPKGR